MTIEQYEFYNQELHHFACEIRKQSIDLIQKVIKEHSLLQMHDIAQINEWNGFVKAQVCEIKLCGNYGMNGYRFSFAYKARLLNKKGEVMKNRNPVWFGSYRIGDKVYSNPSYNRKRIVPATIESESNI